MDDQKDNFDDFEDEFFDDGFEDDAVADDLSDNLGSPDSFGDDWDFDESQQGNKASKGAKKKSSNAVIIGLAVIVGLGVLVYQVMGDRLLGGNKFESSMEEGTQPADMASANTQGDNAEGAVEEKPVDIGALFDDDGMDIETYAEQAASNFEDELPMPAPVAQEEVEVEEVSGFMSDFEFSTFSDTNNFEAAPQAQPEDANISDEDELASLGQQNGMSEDTAVLETEESPASDNIDMGIPQPESTTVDVPDSIGENTINNAPVETTINQMNVTPDLIPSSSEAPEEAQTSAASDNEPVVAETSMQSSVQDEKIVQQLEMVLKRLDQVEGTVSSIDMSPTEEIASLKATIASLEKDIAALKKNPPKASVQSTPKKESKPKATPKKAASRKVSWELRAAQPGKAWVAKKGQKDIKSVSVGDRLDGVGTIRSISFVNGRWVVTGSSSMIRQ